MIARFIYILIGLLLTGSVNASLFTQINLPDELQVSKTLQFSNPSQCIEMIDDFLQTHNKLHDNYAMRVSNNLEKPITTMNLVASKQQKALCNYYAGDTDQAIVILDKLLSTKADNFPLQLNQQSLLIKSFILAQSQDFADLQLAKQSVDLVIANIDNNTYVPTAKDYFTTKFIAGDIALKLNDYAGSITLFKAAQHYARKYPLSNDLAWSNFAIGNNYQQQNKFTLAINFYHKAQADLVDESDILTGVLTQHMSNTYLAQENFKLAISYANQSAQFYQTLGNKYKLSISLLELASMHRTIKEYNLALVYYFNALDIFKPTDNKDKINQVYFELGKTYLNMGNFALAEQYLVNAEQLFIKNGQHKLHFESLLHRANIALQLKQYDVASRRLNRALSIASQLNDNQAFTQVYLYFAIAYEQTQQYEKALESYKHFARYNKLLNFNDKKSQPISDQHKENSELKTQQINQLNLTIAALQESKQNLIFNILLLAFILVLFGYGYYLNKRNMLAQQQVIHDLEDNYNIHPNTGLPNTHSFNRFVPTPLQMTRYYADWESSDKQDYQHNCALIGLDFLTPLREQFSLSEVNNLLAQLGPYLSSQLGQSQHLFQLNDTQLLLISKISRNEDPGQLAAKVLTWFEHFEWPVNTNKTISIGMVAHPFLPKYPTAISSKKLLNIASLALSGACQLSKTTQQNSWLQLSALTYTQPAFFHGNIWQRSQQAIAKGLIKVTASADKNDINWL